MKRKIFEGCVIPVAAAIILILGVGVARAQQGVSTSVSQADQAAAAAAIAGEHYGIELTPTREAAVKGPSAFARLGAAANPVSPLPDDTSPFILPPSTAWGPVDVSYHPPGLTITSWKQWNVYLGCGSSDQTCWGNPQQFITDLNGSRFIHLLDQYVGSTKLKRYPLSNTFIANGIPVPTFFSQADTFSWLLAAVNTAASIPGNSAASVTGPGNVYHLYFVAGTDVCADPANTECYSPDHGATFVFCGYHSWVDFGFPYNKVYFTVEPYQAVSGCFGPTADVTSATANTLSHEIFEAISDPDLDAWYGNNSSPLYNVGEEIGDQCSWTHLFPQKLGKNTYVTQNEYSNKSHSCAAK